MSKYEEPKLKFNIDLDEIEALNQKRTLAFINHWVYHTVLFLNQFSTICQQKLLIIDTKLRRANDLLSTLESKLSSIPGLENVESESYSAKNLIQEKVETSDSVLTQVEDVSKDQEKPVSNDIGTELEKNREQSGGGEEDKKSVVTISSHPDFAPYFKMVNFGVPKEAVKLKMSSSGIDPALLDNPLLEVELKASSISSDSEP